MRANQTDPFLHPDTIYLQERKNREEGEGIIPQSRMEFSTSTSSTWNGNTHNNTSTSYQVLYERAHALNPPSNHLSCAPPPVQSLVNHTQNHNTQHYQLNMFNNNGTNNVNTNRGSKAESSEEEEESPKKTRERYTWSADLHEEFVEAMIQLGEKATAKGVMAVMKSNGADISTLTRIRVANHIQTYRTKQNKLLLKALAQNPHG